MIPKVIHYCWFGGNPKPKLAEKCIKSWKKYCPDYEIVEWNEDNFDISAAPLYVRQAYEAKKWAFVTDYVRLEVVYNHGGVYLDTDVELLKSLDSLLDNKAFFGYENGIHVATGLGFGAEQQMPILAEMMQDYNGIPFIKSDGTIDSTTCPQRNTNVLVKYGLKQDNTKQTVADCLILPSHYLCPINYLSGEKKITADTISIHHFSASWQTQVQKKKHKENKRKIERSNRIHNILHIPHRIIRTILGDAKYENMKRQLKRK